MSNNKTQQHNFPQFLLNFSPLNTTSVTITVGTLLTTKFVCIAMDFGIHELKVKPLSISLLKLTTLILLLIIVTLFQFSNASIHTYDRQSFNEVGNALLLSGGSEGIRASRASLTSSSSKHIVLHSLHDGISFIRYFVFFLM